MLLSRCYYSVEQHHCQLCDTCWTIRKHSGAIIIQSWKKARYIYKMSKLSFFEQHTQLHVFTKRCVPAALCKACLFAWNDVLCVHARQHPLWHQVHQTKSGGCKASDRCSACMFGPTKSPTSWSNRSWDDCLVYLVSQHKTKHGQCRLVLLMTNPTS